ncbi:hypothetical protein PybrP1_011285 [[Pythium] brassicae (nom. inval.)]|nr:hypothetical protein PybrP1_011285 [[Pythium] brassicae (nom. inval.)]
MWCKKESTLPALCLAYCQTIDQRATAATTIENILLTKLQQLSICNRRVEMPRLSYNDLAEWASNAFGLAKHPGKTTIHRIIQSAP